MSILSSLPEGAIRRLTKVGIRTIHLIGIAGVFGGAMMNTSEPVYLTLAILSGVALVIMEAYSGWIWFVQFRGVSLYLKLLLLYAMHLFPETAIPCLIAIIVVSGFISHAPNWIRYFSLHHGKVVHSKDDILG